jgi:hypothetical protein
VEAKKIKDESKDREIGDEKEATKEGETEELGDQQG